MFESDDFDQVLSQFDFPNLPATKDVKTNKSNENIKSTVAENSFVSSTEENHVGNDQNRNEIHTPNKVAKKVEDRPLFPPESQERNGNKETYISPKEDRPLFLPESQVGNGNKETFISPKHMKRKIINSHFDHKSKRKFPGPAGLLAGSLEENKDETICQMELLSQDIEFSQNNLRRDIFESTLWCRLLEDVKTWNLHNIDPINMIKQQALAGNLRRRKAETVTAFIETVDRSATDPLIKLRDSTGNIKCTLHRDAWSTFSSYLVSEYCALVLWKPTVLTTGSAFKKHYLNITLSNIYAIYSSAVLKEDEWSLPDGYQMVREEGFTVIKSEKSPQDLGSNRIVSGQASEENLDDLDSLFSDDQF